jgi:hypothetical protein
MLRTDCDARSVHVFQIAELFVTEPLTFWISLGILLLQLTMAYLMRDAAWYVLLPCAYVIGGTVNHSLQLAVHELSHDLCWSGRYKDTTNRLTAIMANLATGIPSGQTFKPYHMDHHQVRIHRQDRWMRWNCVLSAHATRTRAAVGRNCVAHSPSSHALSAPSFVCLCLFSVPRC